MNGDNDGDDDDDDGDDDDEHITVLDTNIDDIILSRRLFT